MLMNNLDPAVAERPEELIVYGGGGKAARNWECYEKIVATLRRLGNDETLLVQSGKPVGVFRTHEEAPRVLIANAHLVPRWATWDEFRRLDALGLTMYGQMTAGSWIYIGTQGILQGTYETFAECARQHFGGSLEGRLVVTGGLGGMGGAQPLAATMNGAAFLGVDVDESRIRRRVETRYCDRLEHDLDTALRLVEEARARRRPLAVGLVGNIAEVLPGAGPAGCRARRADRPDLGARSARRVHPEPALARRGGRAPRERSGGIREPGARFDGGARPGHAGAHGQGCRHLRLRQQPAGPGGRPPRHARGVRHPRLRSGLHPTAFLPGSRPVSLGRSLGRPGRHRRHRPGGARNLPEEGRAGALDPAGAGAGPIPGTPGPDLLARIRRAGRDGSSVQLAGEARQGAGADRDRPGPPRHRLGGFAQPGDRGDEGRLATRSPTGRCSMPCSTRPAVRAGSRSTTAGLSASATRSTLAWWPSPTAPPWRIAGSSGCSRADPGTGVMRHADAGYDLAIDTARERGVDLPMVNR